MFRLIRIFCAQRSMDEKQKGLFLAFKQLCDDYVIALAAILREEASYNLNERIELERMKKEINAARDRCYEAGLPHKYLRLVDVEEL